MESARHTFRTSVRRLAIVACALLAAACATSADVSALREKPPAPLVLLVEATPPPRSVRSKGDLAFQVDAAAMRSMLASELRALDASSQVVLPGDPGAAEADIRIRLAPRDAIAFEHIGVANFFGAGALWLVTWIGGLIVEDSAYAVRMDADCSFAVVDAEDQFLFKRSVGGGEVDTSFLERNDLFSMSGLQSLILPPFWTSDQAGTTSAALARQSMRIAARQIAAELKNEFENLAETNYRCAVRIEQPRNGQPATASAMPVAILAKSTSTDPVSKVEVAVNGGAPTALAIAKVDEDTVRATGELQGLKTGEENWIRVRVSAGALHTRTLRLSPAKAD